MIKVEYGFIIVYKVKYHLNIMLFYYPLQQFLQLFLTHLIKYKSKSEKQLNN